MVLVGPGNTITVSTNNTTDLTCLMVVISAPFAFTARRRRPARFTPVILGGKERVPLGNRHTIVFLKVIFPIGFTPDRANFITFYSVTSALSFENPLAIALII